jgi:hypothetical protein
VATAQQGEAERDLLQDDERQAARLGRVVASLRGKWSATRGGR